MKTAENRAFGKMERLACVALAVGAFIGAGFAYDTAGDVAPGHDVPAEVSAGDVSQAQETLVESEMTADNQRFATQVLYGYTGLLLIVGTVSLGAAAVPGRKSE